MGLSISYHLSEKGSPEEVRQRMNDWRAQLRKLLPDCRISELIVKEAELSFDFLPGLGTEVARMRLRREGSDVWKGNWDCKTQCAGCVQYGGPANFLKAHLCLISALDIGRSLGLVEGVSDDGGYWTQRSTEKLLKQLRVYQDLVASLVDQVRAAGFSVESAVQDEREFTAREPCPTLIDS